MTKAPTIKLTKHGVLDLNEPRSARTHEHRYLPNTRIARAGNQVTKMICACGDEQEETDDEKIARQLTAAEKQRW